MTKEELAIALKAATINTKEEANRLVGEQFDQNLSAEEAKEKSVEVSNMVLEIDARNRAEVIFEFVQKYVDRRVEELLAGRILP